MQYRQPFRGDYGISQNFGKTEWSDNHTGIDYLCPAGTPILASEAGQVFYAGWKPGGYGYCVFIKHPDGIVTIYEHLLKDVPVAAGQNVTKGQVIGYSGSTGNSTGPHLHFEMRDAGGTALNPLRYLQTVADSLTTGPDIDEPDEPVTDGHGSDEQKQEIVTHGICRIVCDSAWVRDWKNVERSYLVYRGTVVYVFPDVKYRDGLPFRYIGAERCIAEHDAYGTQILRNQE